MSATGRKGKTRAGIKPRHARDFYPTPAWCTTRLLERIGPALLEGVPKRGAWCWLEPAIGNGAIAGAVRNFFRDEIADFTGVDIYRSDDFDAVTIRKMHVASFLDVTFDEWDRTGAKNPGLFDVAITNPPFRIDLEDGTSLDGGMVFVERMLKVAHVVILLHRLDWLASAKRNDFFAGRMPDVYVLPDRPSFTNDGSTDAQTYAWFVWGLTYGGHTHVLATTPIEERREAKIMAPKSTKTGAPAKAPKAPKRKGSAFDADAFDDDLDKKAGSKGKAKTVASDALERARAQAHEDLAAERESKAKGSSKKPVTDAPPKTDVPAASTKKNAEGMRVSKPGGTARLDFRLVEKFVKLFKRDLTADEAKKKEELHGKLEGEIAGLQEKRKRDEKFVDAQLGAANAVTKRAKAEEILVRKKITGAKIGELKALSTQALNAAANRFEWVEVECERRADDYDKKIRVFRLDTNEQFTVDKMTESEMKDSDARRQTELKFAEK
jgi:hypothetical protein